jgi:hypothetical protein
VCKLLVIHNRPSETSVFQLHVIPICASGLSGCQFVLCVPKQRNSHESGHHVAILISGVIHIRFTTWVYRSPPTHRKKTTLQKTVTQTPSLCPSITPHWIARHNSTHSVTTALSIHSPPVHHGSCPSYRKFSLSPLSHLVVVVINTDHIIASAHRLLLRARAARLE